MGMYEGRVKVRKVSFQGVRSLGTIAGSKPRDVMEKNLAEMPGSFIIYGCIGATG